MEVLLLDKFCEKQAQVKMRVPLLKHQEIVLLYFMNGLIRWFAAIFSALCTLEFDPYQAVFPCSCLPLVSLWHWHSGVRQFCGDVPLQSRRYF